MTEKNRNAPTKTKEAARKSRSAGPNGPDHCETMDAPRLAQAVQRKFAEIEKRGTEKSGRATFKKTELAGVREAVGKLPEFLLSHPIMGVEDVAGLSKSLSAATAKKIIEILREGDGPENPKLLKYLGDDGVLKDEKRPLYMSNFTDAVMSPEEFYEIVPPHMREDVGERFVRFIEKQETYPYGHVKTLDQYFRFLGEKVNFPKKGIALLVAHYVRSGFLETAFDEKNGKFRMSFTEKGEKFQLGTRENPTAILDAEYSELTGELRKRAIDMLMKNLQEGVHDTDVIRDELLEEGIIVKKKDLLELRKELFQTMASSSNSKTVIQKLNEEIREENKYEVFGGVYQFVRKETATDGETVAKTYSIPVAEVDEIFRAYSRYGKNLTQKQVMYDFSISKAVWSLLKSRLDLTKDSLPVSPHTLENFKGEPEKLEEFGNSLGNDLVRDEFRKTILDAYDRQKSKEFNRLQKMFSDVEHFLEHLENYLKHHKPRQFDLSDVRADGHLRTEDHVSIAFGDVHLGKTDTAGVVSRIRRVTELALRQPQKHVCLVGLGDWFESVVEGGMHPGQVEAMDGPYGFDVMMLFVELMEEMIVRLNKAGKEVTFYSVGGNHDRLGKGHEQDAKRTANLIVMELIRKGLRNFDVKVEAFRERTNTFAFGDFHYVINHGEDGFSKKAKGKPEEILWAYGDQTKHNVIKFGHEHHGYLGEVRNATIIGTPHLA